MPARNTPTLSQHSGRQIQIIFACASGRKLEGDAPPVAMEATEAARKSVPAGTGREVPPEVLDSIRSLNRDQLVNMLTNYYHSIRGGCMLMQHSAVMKCG